MNSLKPYTKYKPSGIAWLGDIPEHWEVKRIKHLGKAIIGIVYNPRDLCDENEGILVLRSSNVQKEKLDYKDCVYVNQKIRETQITRKNDILICSRNGSINLIGKNALIEGRAVGQTFGAFMTLFRGSYNEYVSYFLKSIQFKAQIGLCFTSTINQLTSGILYNLFLALPKSKAEQTAIANFLDYKTAKIDRFIKKKKQLIKLLNEQKAGIINDAVTKGLDANCKMKPSGIEWLGDIPEHWEVRKLKYSVSLNQHRIFDNEKSINTKIALENIEGKTGRILELKENSFEGIGTIFKKGDVLFGKLRPYLAKVIAPNFEGSCVNEILVLTPNEENWDSVFLKNRMLSKEFIKIVDDSTFGSKMPRASWDFIGGLMISCPPLSDQKAIVSHIETEVTKLNKAIATIEKEITLVQEYKTALIAEAVTGKIDVRDYVIPIVEEELESEEDFEDELSMVAEEGEEYEIEK